MPRSSLKSSVVFGITTGLGGVLLGNVAVASPSYLTPTLFGGVVGGAIATNHGLTVAQGVATGAACGLVSRMLAGWLIDASDVATEQGAVETTRKALFGAALGGAVFGVVGTRFSPLLLKE